MSENCYHLLGLRDGASMDEIKTAYRRLALLYHPDKNISREDGEKFKAIAEAYRILRTNNTLTGARSGDSACGSCVPASNGISGWLGISLGKIIGSLQEYCRRAKKAQRVISACEERIFRNCEKIANGTISHVSSMVASQCNRVPSFIAGYLYRPVARKGIETFNARFGSRTR
ncbi:MAG: DnaJ domain-containing protein [Thaumarchaeota archaeon]|nr:DnaJ domain-containing protein [Nitrososphaerota archaeon]